MRNILNIAIVKMVHKENETTTIHDNTCPAPLGEGSMGHDGFDWSEKLQGVILGAFYWGYVSFAIWKALRMLKISFQAATHVPGGLLAAKYGGKYVLSLGILSTSIFTLITPVVIEWGELLWNNDRNTWYWWLILHSGGAGWLIALRILEGVGEGTTFPAMNTMLAAWIPVNERSKASALVFGGAQVSWLIAT